MKKYYYIFTLGILVLLNTACNKEWESEQYEHYVSFKAPIQTEVGVTPIYIPYEPEGSFTYELPLIVSGSTSHTEDLGVNVAIDPDTLQVLNYARFQDREDLYYKELSSQFFSIQKDEIKIPAKEDVVLMDIDFTLREIDLVDKWVLPLTIVDDASYNYTPHPRKYYKKALLRIIPFNDFSGVYSGTGLKIYLKGEEDGAAIVKNEVIAYVVDEHSMFFYAGMVDENDVNRKKYKINASFDETTNEVELTADDPGIEFKMNSDPTFTVEEVSDAVRPYLVRRYVTINDIDYSYTDYTSMPGSTISYTVKGSLIMERKINTQIPDKDQAIEW